LRIPETAGDGFVPPYLDEGLLPHATEVQARYLHAIIKHGSGGKAAQALGVNKSAINRSMQALKAKAGQPVRPQARSKPAVRRWLLTAAQDETPVHGGFWANLRAYAFAIGAEIMVGGFTYNKALFEDHASRSALFASEVQPYLYHDNVDCGPLLFAAKMNTLPTAVRPLSGLETYSRGRWAVFPHAKVQMVSVPALPGARAAQVMTTGACTLPNYVAKKAGLKAEFHHSIGATIVEVDECNRIFCRQVNATEDGSFQDLDTIVRHGLVTTGNRIEALTAGDLHIEKADPEVFLASFGYDIEKERVVNERSLIHTLRPRHIAWHDILDMMARNHHRRGDHHFAFSMVSGGTDEVEAANRAVAKFLRSTASDLWTSVVVASNHNDALQRWLREADPRLDARNGLYWCELNVALMRAIRDRTPDFDIFQHAVSAQDAKGLSDIVFVPRNGSYLVCQSHGGIEIGMHGDEGPNGARGSALALTRVATRMNIGHAHTPCIMDGVYTAGLSGKMDQGYNSGPSGWSHTHVIVYPNGKRTLVTLWDGKWKA
jgi:hypothetical protein